MQDLWQDFGMNIFPVVQNSKTIWFNSFEGPSTEAPTALDEFTSTVEPTPTEEPNTTIDILTRNEFTTEATSPEQAITTDDQTTEEQITTTLKSTTTTTREPITFTVEVVNATNETLADKVDEVFIPQVDLTEKVWFKVWF